MVVPGIVGLVAIFMLALNCLSYVLGEMLDPTRRGRAQARTGHIERLRNAGDVSPVGR